MDAEEMKQSVDDITTLISRGTPLEMKGKFGSFLANDRLGTIGIWNCLTNNCIAVADYERRTLRVRRNSWYRPELEKLSDWTVVVSDNMNRYHRGSVFQDVIQANYELEKEACNTQNSLVN
jgi:hypothetical protein